MSCLQQSLVFMYLRSFRNFLTSSLPQPVKFPCWKTHGHALKNSIVSSLITNLFSVLCGLMKILSPRFESVSAVLPLQKLWSVDTVLRLCLSNYETVKCRSHSGGGQCSDRYIISPLPPTSITPSPLPQSLIRLMVSLDVKHHVYLYCYVVLSI